MGVMAVILAGVCAAVADVRTWSDATGKFKVEAELSSVNDGMVTLKTTAGKEVTVPLERLSDEDRAFVDEYLAKEPLTSSATASSASNAKADNNLIQGFAEQFYKDLRTKEREAACGLLTKTAQGLFKSGKSPVVGLPMPDESANGIKVGKVTINDKTAEVIVFVRVGGKSVKTVLHLRTEGDEWRVFAISAKLGEDEKTLNFEKPAGSALEKEDPLLALVGKSLEIEGYTVDGKKLRMDQFKDKVVLIDFWATWCGPCKAEMPNILANWKQYHDSGFEVIAISVDTDLGDLRKFVAAEQPPWTVVADYHPLNRTKVADKYGISGIPALVLIGKDGRVAAVHCRGKKLGKQLSKLLGDSSAASISTSN